MIRVLRRRESTWFRAPRSTSRRGLCADRMIVMAAAAVITGIPIEAWFSEPFASLGTATRTHSV